MKVIRFAFGLFLSMLIPGLAVGQNVRSWVATSGLDTNDCTRANPCRTFGRAIDVTNTDGEVAVLESGGYGAVTITKPVKIVAPPGVHAAIAPTSGDAITATASSLRVELRNLYLNSQGAFQGIVVAGSGTVVVEGCTVAGFTYGIVGALDDGGAMAVRNSVVRDNSQDGIRIQAETGTASASIEDTLILRNAQTGLIAFSGDSNIRVVARNVTSMANSNQFFASVSPGPGNAELILDGCSAIGTGLGYGVRAFAPGGAASTVRVSNSRIVANEYGVFEGSATSQIQTRGDNTLELNTNGNTFPHAYTAK